MRYVALGDSYTIGTSVAAAERWPERLVAALGPAEPTLFLVANLGVNGYTSADLIRRELPALGGLRPEFATVLIGVNDVVRRVHLETYATNVERILDGLLARLPPTRIVTVATPDYTVTPAGADYGDPGQQHDAIVAANATMARLAAARAIAWVDTFDISLRAADDRSLVAGDGLHPSGAQYAPVGRADPARGRSARPSLTGLSIPALQLVEPLVGDPEMVGDLVVDGVRDGRRQLVRRPAVEDERLAEDGDLARCRGRVRGQAGPRNALIQAVQPVRADERELVGRRLVLDDDRHAPELVAELGRQRVERVVDHVLDLVVGRRPAEHRQTIARPAGTGVSPESCPRSGAPS